MTAVAPHTPVIGCGVVRIDNYVCVGEDCDGIRHFFMIRLRCPCGVAVAGKAELHQHQLDCELMIEGGEPDG